MPYAVIDYNHWRYINPGDPLAAGETLMSFVPEADTAQKFADYSSAITDGVTGWLSAYVNELYGYDDIVSAVSFAGDKDPTFDARGTAAMNWRSDCFKSLDAALVTYEALPMAQWPTIGTVTAALPQPSSYTWEPVSP